MKPFGQLVLTVLLVAAGIYVYDTFVQRPVAEPVPEIRRESPAPAAPDEEPAPLVMLQGTGDGLWRDALEQRLEALEQQIAGGEGRVQVVPGDTGPDVVADLLAEAGAGEGAEAGEDGEAGGEEEDARARRAEQVRRFRTLLEAVERQRRWEKEVATIQKFLGGLDLKLTDDQRKNLIRTTVHYKARWQALAATPTPDEAAKEARRESSRVLYNEFEQSVRNLVPTAEADVIFEALRNANRGDRK